jgi:two-component system, cell cycle sensor histidine kinase and response regulator CckA
LKREPESPLFAQTQQTIERLVQNIEEATESDEVIHAATRGPVSNLTDLADLAVLVLFQPDDHHRVEVAAREPARESKAGELITHALPALERVARQDWQNGRHFRWLSRITDRAIRFLRVEPELVQLLGQLEISSLVVVPLQSGSKVLGALALARTFGTGKWYQAKDLAITQIIARRAAVAIENAELRQRHQDEEHRRHRLEGTLQKWIRVFDVAGWGAAIVDAEKLRIDAANPAFARMHGYSDPEALGGQPYSSLLAPQCAGETAEWTSQEEGSQTYESVHVRLNGGSIPVLTSVTSLDLAGRARAYVVTVQDMTELKRAEERLRRAQRMEAVGRLAGGVAHEVNNMMTIILGFSDLLTGAVDLPPARQRDVEEIRKAAIRTARVTQQLLAFSRQQILQPIDLQLNEVVREMSSVLQHLLPTNVKVELVLSPVPAMVHADRAQIDQVLINLAFNARDAMPLGGTLRLATDSRYFEPDDVRGLIGISVPAGPYAVLSVSDTGHGMTPDTLSQVFEPFFTTKPAGTGTGLGLATVYGIVKQSGGFIWVDSEPDVGTTFSICFPQVESRKPMPAEPPHDEPQEQPRPSATVLIVEDEEGVRELARRVLEQDGYAVLDVKTGADAIAALDGGAPDIDLMLVDVVTPDLPAIELEAGVRARRPELPLLYMSGYSWEEVVSRGLVSGQRPFIQKPFTAAELVRAVAHELTAGRPRGRTVTT